MRTSPNVLVPIAVTFALAFALAHLPIEYAIAVAAFSGAGLVSIPEDRRRSELSRIREALTMCGYTIKSAAATARMDIADFSRMLSPEHPGKLDYWRLAMLGEEFQRTLAMLAIRDLDLPQFVRHAIKIETVVKIVTKEIA